MSTAAATYARDEALWAEEVARVLEGAAALVPVVGPIARDVLTPLIAGAAVGRVSRRDASAMRRAVSRPGCRVI